MSKKLAICVPHYRRKEHLDEFIPHMENFMEKYHPDIEFKIFVANQIEPDTILRFNRGTAKNIAFAEAVKQGYDYFCFHDIDMLPEDETCDYSYPKEHPKHIAVHISQFDYMLPSIQYFGGAVLFTKEQYEQINGYSNDYWNWGMEDDDLLWRCEQEGFVNRQKLSKSNKEVGSVSFDGIDSYIEIPPTPTLRELTTDSFTWSILVKSFDNFDIPMYLIGDLKNRKYVHNYILGRPGYQMGFAYDNSRAYSFSMYDYKNNHNYMWLKRNPDTWTHLLVTMDSETEEIRFYMNGEESDARFGHGVESPLKMSGKPKRYGGLPYYLGVKNPTDVSPNNYFYGEVSQLGMWNRVLTKEEIKKIYKSDYTDLNEVEDCKLYYDFKKIDENFVYDLSGNENHGVNHGCDWDFTELDDIEHTIVPHRRNGRFKSLKHPINGIVNNRFVFQEDTSRNEKRFFSEVQYGLWDTKQDGVSDLKYEVDSVDKLGRHDFINFICRHENIPEWE